MGQPGVMFLTSHLCQLNMVVNSCGVLLWVRWIDCQYLTSLDITFNYSYFFIEQWSILCTKFWKIIYNLVQCIRSLDRTGPIVLAKNLPCGLVINRFEHFRLRAKVCLCLKLRIFLINMCSIVSSLAFLFTYSFSANQCSIPMQVDLNPGHGCNCSRSLLSSHTYKATSVSYMQDMVVPDYQWLLTDSANIAVWSLINLQTWCASTRAIK
jgi:hypothetical protein